MNSTFKVVFNKARGALMVVNEITSFVQAKGTKSVIASAIACIASGVAIGADVYTANGDVTVTAGADGESYNLVVDDRQLGVSGRNGGKLRNCA